MYENLCVPVSEWMSACLHVERACYIYFYFWFFILSSSRLLALGCCCHFMCVCIYACTFDVGIPSDHSSDHQWHSTVQMNIYMCTNTNTHKHTFPNLFRNSKMSSVNFIPCVFFSIPASSFRRRIQSVPLFLRAANNAYKHRIKCALGKWK